jgi:transcriptional regulator
MYNLPQYKEKDQQKILTFMREHPFITLVGTSGNRVEVTQIPVMIDERDGHIYLSGHIVRKSDHHNALEKNPEALVLFTSPHIYISGTWYIGNLQQASTWNYISVHARGPITFLDETALIALLKRFTLHFENGNKDSTTIYDNLPASYLDKLLNAIVPFEIKVTELEHVFKISQNRDELSYHNIIKNLETKGDSGKFIAEKMKENVQELFPSK